jgi:hypothetical protein
LSGLHDTTAAGSSRKEGHVSYLTSFATRTPRKRGGTGGVDEKIRLNLPGFHGDAYVRVFVEDTTFRKWRRRPREPKIRLRIADCSNEISLWFELDSDAARENSLHKIDTLLGALQRFRAALDAEAELYAHRAQHRR